MTITKSPVSALGVKIGLFLPRSTFAISLAMRPKYFALRINDVPVPLCKSFFGVHDYLSLAFKFLSQFAKNGGADETRTRDLRRDRPAF